MPILWMGKSSLRKKQLPWDYSGRKWQCPGGIAPAVRDEKGLEAPGSTQLQPELPTKNTKRQRGRESSGL